jgi:CheY-like chemotaxis protein
MKAAARVVLVEPEPDIRALLVDLLDEAFSSHPHIVTEAETGAEAIALCTSTEVDVVVLELELPDISGLDVIAELTAQPPTPCLIAFSADPRGLIVATELGAHQAVDKTAGVSQLLAAVQHCLHARDRQG